MTPLTPMRVQTAKSMSRLADHLQKDSPDLPAHQHLRDAARTLRAGNEEASQRHLRAAMFSLTPQSLMRNGQHTDDAHLAARQAMHGLHRHLLLVKDISDVAARNQAAIRRDSYDDDSSSPPPLTSPVRAGPNAGYGPGALAQKPAVRQPPGNQALNAPARAGTGKPDPNVADPVGPQPRGSKQFAYGWDDLSAVVELASRPKVTELSAASRLKAHDTASATAHRTASEHAKMDEARNAHGEFAKVGVADLVLHHDGTVGSKKTKAAIGSLAHEDGKWAATHADGTVTKHATKQAALAAIVTRHNKAGKAAAIAAPGKPATAAVPPDSHPAGDLAAPGKPAAAKAGPAPQAPAPAAAKVPIVHAADLTVHKDGSVTSKKTGAQVGAISKAGAGYSATHADGTVTQHATKVAAVKAVVTSHNKAAKGAAAGNAGASSLKPKPSAPAAAAKAAAAQPPQPKLSQAEKRRLTGIWSVSYRYSGKSGGAGKEGQDFTDELHRLLSTNKPPDVCGKGCQEAHKFLSMVDQDATVQHKELRRGITLDAADAKRMFTPGKTMDMPAASWTTKASTAVQFSKGDAGPGKTKVILHTAPPAKGLDIAGMSNYPTEAEVVTGGRYSVDSVKTVKGVMHVYVTQGDFSAH
jgi:hypothetical protein